VARARSSRAGWRNIRFIAGDVTVEPDLEEFDGVLCTLGLSAMKDHRAAITAVGGALKGGGRLAVLDAGRYRGLAAALNPFLRLSYRYAVGADVDKDIVGAIEREFGAVQEERFFGGSAFIAVATR
jgi:ubiquinone/menaquinone biosynthesis C-methylase UbiE